MFCCDWDQIAQNKSDLENAVRAGRSVAPFTFVVVSESPEQQLVCSRTYAAKKYPSVMPAIVERRAIPA